MKTNTNYSILCLTLLVLSVIGCKQSAEDKKAENQEETTETVEEKSIIKIERLAGSPAYESASLTLNSPDTEKKLPSGAVNFSFAVNNYELGAQTESENANRLANSDKGQHIHFILNNKPYSAHYEANFQKEIPDGVHHLIAFLSRSYHESVKNENSMVVKKMMVGDNPVDNNNLDMEAPTLIYSRPKGEYSGKNIENLMLDFFVLNTTLAENGNKVRATINGEEFIITEWAPYVITGLEPGEVSLTLELLDSDGAQIPGPFNKVTRTVKLKE